MTPTRKILCIGAFAVLALGGVVAFAAARKPSGHHRRGDLRRAALSQAGRELILSLRTARPVALASLDRLPSARRGGSRYLCLDLRPAHGGGRRICLGGRRDPLHRAGLELLNAAGGAVHKTTIRVHVKRPKPRKLVLALEPAAAKLRPRRYRWRAVENRRGCRRCGESLPARGRSFRLRAVRAVGCTGGGAGLVTNGSRDRKVVALTFDDGPSDYTNGFLDVLRDKGVHGTFFEIGQETAGREATMRRILGEGSEIGNHTTHHDAFPGYWDLAGTDALIRSATGFEPCLFRPPGGAVDGAVVAAAGEAGLKTITWDVDPSDWTDPGSGAVYDRVVGAAQPGSIILMHDGGGDRSGTLAALPRIISTLRRRGYRFATVSELLGHRIVYRPHG